RVREREPHLVAGVGERDPGVHGDERSPVAALISGRGIVGAAVVRHLAVTDADGGRLHLEVVQQLAASRRDKAVANHDRRASRTAHLSAVDDDASGSADVTGVPVVSALAACYMVPGSKARAPARSAASPSRTAMDLRRIDMPAFLSPPNCGYWAASVSGAANASLIRGLGSPPGPRIVKSGRRH